MVKDLSKNEIGPLIMSISESTITSNPNIVLRDPSLENYKTVLENPSLGNHIMSFLAPSPTFSATELEEALKNYYSMALVNTQVGGIYRKQLLRLQQILYIVKKYPQYEGVCGKRYVNEKTGEVLDGYGPSYLYELLKSGLSAGLGEISRPEYNIKEIEKDIRIILKVMPESIHYNGGSLSGRSLVNPLLAACYNPNIPVHVIDWLFQTGANPRAITKDYGGNNITVYSDAKRNNRAKNHMTAEEKKQAETRFSAIVDLFADYGLDQAKKDLEAKKSKT